MNFETTLNRVLTPGAACVVAALGIGLLANGALLTFASSGFHANAYLPWRTAMITGMGYAIAMARFGNIAPLDLAGRTAVWLTLFLSIAYAWSSQLALPLVVVAAVWSVRVFPALAFVVPLIANLSAIFTMTPAQTVFATVLAACLAMPKAMSAAGRARMGQGADGRISIHDFLWGSRDV